MNNLRFSRKPAATVFARSTSDVVAAINCATAWGVRVSAAGGRHAYQGTSVQDGYLTVDLSNMTKASTECVKEHTICTAALCTCAHYCMRSMYIPCAHYCMHSMYMRSLLHALHAYRRGNKYWQIDWQTAICPIPEVK